MTGPSRAMSVDPEAWEASLEEREVPTEYVDADLARAAVRRMLADPTWGFGELDLLEIQGTLDGAFRSFVIIPGEGENAVPSIEDIIDEAMVDLRAVREEN